ncbi:hypothetical protein AB8810_11075 [Xanthomonas sp. NCPPB 3005]|uniref:hypothetical protein n=1 Tax=Xanthomonas sp. NCPPB 3005 TaxID=3240913 RepID=UPI0035135C28
MDLQHSDYDHGYYAPEAPRMAVAWHNHGWVLRARLDGDAEAVVGSDAMRAIVRFRAGGRQKFAEGRAS